MESEPEPTPTHLDWRPGACPSMKSYFKVVFYIAIAFAAAGCRRADNKLSAKNVGPWLTADVPTIGLAAYKGDVSLLKKCLKAGVNIESAGSDKRTPLILAAAGRQTAAAVVLLQERANVNAQDTTGETALHWAAKTANDELVQLLVERGADVNVRGRSGETPLIFAAMSSNEKAVATLLASGADPRAKDADGYTARSLAESNYNAQILKLLSAAEQTQSEQSAGRH
jgi:ankyrin repeat protein